jgi:hypothetical protein
MPLLAFINTTITAVRFRVLDAGAWREVNITPRGSVVTNGEQVDGVGAKLLDLKQVLPGNPATAAIRRSKPVPAKLAELLTPNVIGSKSTFVTTESFETIANNHRGLDVIHSALVDGVSLTKVFDSGNGTTITLTVLMDAQGNPATKTLSGDGLPPGIDTTCTYDFSGDRAIPLTKHL